MAHWIDTNLSFEYELVARPHSKIDTFSQPWSFLLRLLPSFENAHLLEIASSPKNTDSLEVWGVLDRHRKLHPQTWPTKQAVTSANSKNWAFEHSLDDVLPQSRLISKRISSHELQKYLPPSYWLLKDPFGVSGREQFLGESNHNIDAILAWLTKRKFEHVLLEPKVEIEREFSIHYFISSSGEITYKGESALLCDKNGAFRGNYRVPEEWYADIEEAKGRQVAVLDALCEIGYFGPLSFDSYRGTLNGCSLLRGVSEINARYSFGRMFIEMQRGLNEQDILWWHPSQRMRKRQSLLSAAITRLPFPSGLGLEKTGSALLSPAELAISEIEKITRQ